MKGISTLLLVFGCLAIAAQATYLRVIHAVAPGDSMMDVYYTSMDTGEKIRLFQDLNYTDIPPYFFIPIVQNSQQVQLSFFLKSSENNSEQLIPQEELQNLPSQTFTLRVNLTYSLIVASSSQQDTQDQNQDSQNQTQDSQDQGSQGQSNQTLQYLLLNDYNQAEVPEDLKLVRLINLAEDASTISLIDSMGECSQDQQNQTSQGTQDQQAEESQDQSQDPLVQEIGYLEASDYIDLPEETEPTNLFICHQGQKIPVTPAPLFRASGSRFSILLFTGSSSQQGNQNQTQGLEDQGLEDQGLEDQGLEDQGLEDQGLEDQGEQTQGEQGSQDQEDQGLADQGEQDSQDQESQGQESEFVAYVVSDEPVTTQNVRIRIVHAESSLPAVNVMLDGQQIFKSVTFGNVTEYYMTVRGIHNITVSVDSQQDSQGMRASNSSSIKIVTFFAWTKSYTIAIVRTSSGQLGLESQEGQQEQGQEQGMTEGEPSRISGEMFPGFQGNLHKIFVDEISQNATLGSNYAYIQFIHLASNVGTVSVSLGEQNITNIRFLQSSQYQSVPATSQQVPVQVFLARSNTPILSFRTSLQPGTLYTFWALQYQNSQSPLIFLTKDRQIQIQCVVMDSEMMEQGSQE